MAHNSNKLCLCSIAFLIGCSGIQKNTEISAPTAKEEAIQFLNDSVKPLPNATLSSSNEIDWPVGSIPWNRYTLPTIAPNGFYATVQMSKTPALDVLTGRTNELQKNSIVSICPLDPEGGANLRPIQVEEEGVLLTTAANDGGVLVEKPLGEQGRWIGIADYATGQVEWLIADEYLNMSPAISLSGNMAWSRRSLDDDRFHLVVHSARGQFVIDDGESDWLFPLFIGEDKLRTFQLKKGELSLVELDINSSHPLLTKLSIPIMHQDATRQHVIQIATTNPRVTGQLGHSFYSPIQRRMATWDPDREESAVLFKTGSIAAVPVQDGSWIVALSDRVLRQIEGEHDGIHLRNQSAIPVATSSRQWTHFMLIPDGTRLLVRAMSLKID